MDRPIRTGLKGASRIRIKVRGKVGMGEQHRVDMEDSRNKAVMALLLM